MKLPAGITEAIQAAKKRTGAQIAVSVKGRMFQIEAIQYDDKGVATVSVLVPDLMPSEVVAELNKL